MANSKISALTSATTPLAGTETLPVVQGGVTKQVSVANLTAGRAISVLAVNQAGTSAGLQSYFGFTSGLNYIGIGYNGVTYSTLIGYDVTNEFGQIQPVRGAGVYGNLKLCPSGGDVLIGNNLVPSTAAKGINFTANSAAAGMTSQLLNWYETGTWTPTYVTSGTNFTSVTYNSATSGRYVRIGNLVFISCRIATDGITVGSASGELRVGGLPFQCNSAANAALSISQAYNWASNTPIAAQVRTGATPTAELFYRTTVTGATSNNAYTDADTGASGKNQLFLAGCYYTA